MAALVVANLDLLRPLRATVADLLLGLRLAAQPDRKRLDAGPPAANESDEGLARAKPAKQEQQRHPHGHP